MAISVPVQQVNLRYLIDNFGLQRVRDPKFFEEWQTDLPELTEMETLQLDRIRESYFNLVDHPPVLENVVKLTIISPLLFVAGFYLSPFHIKCEKSIEITDEDEGIKINGRINILVLKNNLWVTVIESKQLDFSLEKGLAQILTYMLADPHKNTPTFGLITNGVNFSFIKLVREGNPKYALSDEFVIRNQANELYKILKILKRLSA